MWPAQKGLPAARSWYQLFVSGPYLRRVLELERSGAALSGIEKPVQAAVGFPQGNLDRARDILRSVWGYPDFRYAQRRAVLSCLLGRDCLAILPTGGGKSLCFQVPALVLPGLTVVVSPLISLMQDQVATLQSKGVAAVYLSSSQDQGVQRRVREVVSNGRAKMLYLAPERLAQLSDVVGRRAVSLLAIDEAHCISEWGHDFRPHYREIGRYRAQLGIKTVLAVTASATPATRRDIIQVARLQSHVSILQSFDRPNLNFTVRQFKKERDRLLQAARDIRGAGGSAIIYVPTRIRTDGYTQILRQWGFQASPYHAGLPSADRSELLTKFISGDVRVMVATNAFGMGIDKSDVRLVIHLGIPTRPEAYYQEAGRAGRDGRPADCNMYWTKQDLVLVRFMAGVSKEKTPPMLAKRTGLETMIRYAMSRKCRRKILLGYLGEEGIECTSCDVCSHGR